MFKYDISKTPLYDKVKELVHNKAWPFQSVKPSEFLDSARLLVKNLDDVMNGKIDGKKLPPDVFQDQNTYATIQMLKCVQKLEYEQKCQEVAEMVSAFKGELITEKSLAMDNFVTWAKEEMYHYNNFANRYMEEALSKAGLQPRYISVENEREYIPDTAVEYTDNTITEHKTVFDKAYAEIDKLVKYGIPSDGALGQLKDKIGGHIQEQKENLNTAEQLLKSELNVDAVQLYILPKLELMICEAQAKAAMEKENQEKGFVMGGLDYYQKEYEKIVNDYNYIKDSIKAMVKQELADHPGKSIKVTQTPSGRHKLEAKIFTGTQSIEKQEHHSTTVSKDYKAKSLEVVLGSTSQAVYEQAAKRECIVRGYSAEFSKDIIKNMSQGVSIQGSFDAAIGQCSASITHTTKLSGKRSTRLEAKFNPARIEGKITGVRKDYTGQTKKHTLAGVSLSAGSLSASVDNKHVLPVAKANAKFVEGSAEILGIKANASLGSAGVGLGLDPVDTLKDIGKSTSHNILEQWALPNQDSVKQDLINKAQSAVNTSAKGPSINTSALGVSAYNFGIKDQQFQLTKDNIQELTELADTVKENITTGKQFEISPANNTNKDIDSQCNNQSQNNDDYSRDDNDDWEISR